MNTPRFPSLIALVGSALLAHVASAASAQDTSAYPQLAPIGRGRISAVYDIDVAPPYAFALERELLHVLDVRDPGNVREVAQLPFEGSRLRSTMYGSYLYLHGDHAPLAVIDISTPTEPRWVRELPELDATLTRGMELVGDIAYLVRNPDPRETITLDVLDLTGASGLPHRLAALDLDVRVIGEYGGIAHDGTHVYILVRPSGARRNQIIVVNIAQPDQPTIEGRIPLPEGEAFNDLEVRGDICYLVRGGPSYGLATFRLRGTEEPELLGSVTDTLLWYGADLIVRDDVAYVTFKGGGPLATFDVANPHYPRLVHVYTDDAAGLGMSLVDDRLYVSGDAGPTSILDVASPRAPRFLGHWDFRGGWATDLVLNEQLALIVDAWGMGIFLYDITNPTAPKRLMYRKDAGSPSNSIRADFRDNRILVAHYDSVDAQLVDVSNPAAPRVVERFQPSPRVEAVALTSTHAVLGYEAGGLRVIDLKNPDAPDATVQLQLEGRVTDLAVHGDRAVVAHFDGGITVVDLRAPKHPVVVGRTRGESRAEVFPDWRPRVTRLALSQDGEMAYVIHADLGPGEREARGVATLTIVDMRAGGSPHIVGRVDFERHDAYEFPVTASKGEVLVGVGMELVRLDVTDPQRPTVAARYRLKQTMDVAGLAVRGKHVYVTAAEDGLLVYELPPLTMGTEGRTGRHNSLRSRRE